MRLHKLLKPLLILFLSPILFHPSLIQAEGGLIIHPYWTFETKSSVTHVQTGDINGDGLPEVVALTADNTVYIVENDGGLNWRYQVEPTALDLLVDDLAGDKDTAEIFIETTYQHIMLSEKKRPVWAEIYGTPLKTLKCLAADLEGDGQREIIWASDRGVDVYEGQTGNLRVDVTGVMPVVDVWVGDVSGDGHLEIAPNRAQGNKASIFDKDGHLIWEQEIDGEMGLVQGGDVDGDGQAEIVILSANWELFLLESDGSQIWRRQIVPNQDSTDKPAPGQLSIHDLNSDGRMEIVALSPTSVATVHVYNEDGDSVWQHPLKTASSSARLTIGDVNDDGQAEIVVSTIGQTQIYLLAADGQRLAEYHTTGTTGALAYADLNNDGWGEIIAGTESGVRVFGAPTLNQATWRELWRSPRLGNDPGSVAVLDMGDLDGDDQAEVVAGARNGRVFVLYGDGASRSTILDAAVQALDTGDIDGDGRDEIVVGTFFGTTTEQIQLLDNLQQVWAAPGGTWVSSIVVHKPTTEPDAQAKIIAGVKLEDNSNAILLLNSRGEEMWRRKFDRPVTAVGSDDEQVLVATGNGLVYRLTASGEQVGMYELGAKVLSLEANWAATAQGQIYRLDKESPVLVHEFGEIPTAIQLGELLAAGFEKGRFSAWAGDELIRQGTVESEITTIVAADINGDGGVEIAVGTEENRVHLFGLGLDQPLLLTKLDLTETRTGYSYSVNINDPAGNAVPVTLEIWDPSDGVWIVQAAQFLPDGQTQGRLTWEAPQPFDIWDSGQESRFRFTYADGQTQRTSPEVAGPFTIPTTPWYVYYGQRIGLGSLILLVPALGFVLYRRQRAYRRSPMGQAESLLQELRINPHETLPKFHALARDNSALLTYLPDLAREAGEPTIADLSEAFHLILIRPEVTGEDLQAVGEAIERLNAPPDGQITGLTKRYELLRQMLEANSVSRIVALRSPLDDVVTTSVVQVVQPQMTTEAVTTNQETLVEALSELRNAAQTLRNYERVETIEDKVAYLAQAIETLGRLEREFRITLPQPERNILARIAATWLRTTHNALQDLQGRARIEVALKTRQLLAFDEATLRLEVRNTGRSPASNLTITLLPDQTFTSSQSVARLDILPAGRAAVVELPISAAPSVDRFRPQFTITFDDRERSGKTVAFADRVQLLRPTVEFQPVPNPYAPGTPLRSGSPIFFGRDDLFQFIAENMAGLTRQNILVLIGQRRMGKTSFLQQLPARLGDEYLPVYIDGQSLGIDPGMTNFFYDLALAIADGLADAGLEIEEMEAEDFAGRPSRIFERTFLSAVFELIGERQLLLLFDEFEELEMRVVSGKLDATIFPFFRHLMQHERRLGFIFVGTHRLEALSSDYWSIFFNIALYKHIVFLDEAAARSLIVEPVAEYGLLHDDLALDKMLRVTAGHPYFLQLTCHALINRANREQRSYVTIQDVNDVLDEMVELGEAHFAFLWEQSSPPEQLVLASLPRLLNQEPTATAIQIGEQLAGRGVSLAASEVTDALRRLVERDIIREVAGQPSRYDYKVDLVRLWVERYKALGRVMDEST